MPDKYQFTVSPEETDQQLKKNHKAEISLFFKAYDKN